MMHWTSWLLRQGQQGLEKGRGDHDQAEGEQGSYRDEEDSIGGSEDGEGNKAPDRWVLGA
jgi:hypothetical protein